NRPASGVFFWTDGQKTREWNGTFRHAGESACYVRGQSYACPTAHEGRINVIQHVSLEGRAARRRTVLRMLGAAAALAPLAGPHIARAAAAGGSGRQLNIYSWPDYFSTADLNAYAHQSGITPTVSTFNSNETLFAKLNSPAGAGFDIVIPSSSW